MEPPPIRDDGLQLQENREFQRVSWTVERVAWLIVAALLMLALLGFTGAGGAFSRTTATLDNMSVDYPTISRWGYMDHLTVRLDSASGMRRLTIDEVWFRHFAIEAMQPHPARRVSDANGTTFEFAAATAGPIEVVLHIRSIKPGVARFEVAAEGPAQSLSTLILP